MSCLDALQQALDLTFGMNRCTVDHSLASKILTASLNDDFGTKFASKSTIDYMNVLSGYLVACKCNWKFPEIAKALTIWKNIKVSISYYYQGIVALTNKITHHESTDYYFNQIDFKELEDECESNTGYACAWKQFILADCYIDGYGITKNLLKARHYLELSCQQGHAPAQNNLAGYFETGTLGIKDLPRAIRLYKEAARQGCSCAMNNLATCYENGIGVNSSMDCVIDLYKEAAAQHDIAAMLNLADIYFCQKKCDQGIKLCEYLSDQGDPDAQFMLGLYYDNQKDGKNAIKYYELSSTSEHPGALNNLAVCYRNGNYVTKNVATGIMLYQMSARLGDAMAKNTLAILYEQGQGVVQDMQRAFVLYQESALAGNYSALNNLAICYKHGFGVGVNQDIAAELYTLSAGGGNREAKKNLLHLYDTYDIEMAEVFRYFIKNDIYRANELYRRIAEQRYREKEPMPFCPAKLVKILRAEDWEICRIVWLGYYADPGTQTSIPVANSTPNPKSFGFGLALSQESEIKGTENCWTNIFRSLPRSIVQYIILFLNVPSYTRPPIITLNPASWIGNKMTKRFTPHSTINYVHRIKKLMI
jgi:TPR repeat protein